MPRVELDEKVLQGIAGGNFGYLDPENDGVGSICVFHYDEYGKEVPDSGYLKYDNYDAVKSFILANRKTMSDLEMFGAMKNAGILHE